ncbi:MAG TPA: ATP-binding cassette domain-containing protein, partial [Paracoccaceae bacterium]|nr:ATP-binding cassette domain-containing protein [Paracoccaceae bacterium]
MSIIQPTSRKLSFSDARSSGLFRAAFVFSIFVNLLMFTGPLFMLQVYDRVLGSRSEETLVALFGLIAVLYLFYGLLEYARGRVLARVGARLETEIGPMVFDAALERAALKRSIPSGASAMQDLETLRAFFASPILLALFDIPWTPLFLAAIFIFHPYLGWFAVAGGGFIVVMALANQIFTARRVKQAQEHAATASGFARHSQQGAEQAYALGMMGAMRTRWKKLQVRALSDSLGASDLTGIFSAITRSFRLLLQSGMLALAAWLVLQNEVTAGAMIASSIMMGRALAPIEHALAQWPMVQKSRTSWKNLKEFLDASPQAPAVTQLPPPEPALNAINVTVALQRGDKPLLQGVTLYVAPGESLGIIGKSGAGKSTLARVLTGLLQPNIGEVRLGGATLDQYGPERLGNLMGYLPQDVILFDGTVAENIGHMALEPNVDKVVTAAKRARVHEVILQLPNGYDTRIGTWDTQLSGGQ